MTTAGTGEPDPASHALLLCASHRRWTGRALAPPALPPEARVRWLENAPFALVSHGTGPEPVFNYGNATALRLFEMDRAAFLRLPSRRSAEPAEETARRSLMERVAAHGFVTGYDGVRVSATGRRFRIEDVTIWNLVDDAGVFRGQAACFAHWTFLDGRPEPAAPSRR